ncbi:MAG: hypothetical protein HYY09_07420 [Firmicutes bacterium]|nr:hypothetical protein [Bacillota bacterium]
MLLFTDFEEGVYYGAKAFISSYVQARNARVVIGLDAGGLS